PPCRSFPSITSRAPVRQNCVRLRAASDRPCGPCLRSRSRRFEKQSATCPAGEGKNRKNNDRSLGSLFQKYLALHHSAREDVLLRKNQPGKKKGVTAVDA